jgi:hypothetical protein
VKVYVCMYVRIHFTVSAGERKTAEHLAEMTVAVMVCASAPMCIKY